MCHLYPTTPALDHTYRASRGISSQTTLRHAGKVGHPDAEDGAEVYEETGRTFTGLNKLSNANAEEIREK